ncbi:MAG: metallopeptidase family protein [Beijerinckiaceae bacterium]
MEALARAAFDDLPEAFRALCAEVVLRVADFPDPEDMRAVEAESRWDLLGLFVGEGLAHRSATPWTGQIPNTIYLYRLPILEFWADGEDTLGAIVTHVLVHEIGHHFGLSDEDMERIDDAPD